jgi:hypothetical protein
MVSASFAHTRQKPQHTGSARVPKVMSIYAASPQTSPLKLGLVFECRVVLAIRNVPQFRRIVWSNTSAVRSEDRPVTRDADGQVAWIPAASRQRPQQGAASP